MEAYVTMYEVTGEEEYLSRLVRHADAVLAWRDSERGILDYRGRALPGWTVGAPYGIGELELKDATGRPTLFVSTALGSYNHETHVTVRAGKTPETFDLSLENARNKMAHNFTDLTMQPQAENYAVKVLCASPLADPTGLVRLKARDLKAGGHNPAPIEASLQTPQYLWAVHQGMLLHPMAALARVVERTPQLRAQPRWKTKADEYVKAAESLLDAIEDEWRENEQGEGWYAARLGAPVWFDGVDLPHNQFLAIGRVLVEFAAATAKPKWRERATRMARTFKNDLVVQPNGSVIWGYWWSKGRGFKGWTPPENVSTNTPGFVGRSIAEDISHGSIDVGFAWLCYRDGIVFNREDMARFTHTFLHNIASQKPDGTPTLWQRVDGTGAPGSYDTTAVGWMRFAQIDPRIGEIYRKIYRDVEWSGRPIGLLASANMNRLAAPQQAK